MDIPSVSVSRRERITELRNLILERRQELAWKRIASGAELERKKFLRWALPELVRIDPERYKKYIEPKTSTEAKVISELEENNNETHKSDLIVESATPTVSGFTKKLQKLTSTFVSMTTDPKTLIAANEFLREEGWKGKPRIILDEHLLDKKSGVSKVNQERLSRNQRILEILERKLTTQEPLTKNDKELIRMIKFETEEDRMKFVNLAKKEENKNNEAAYLVGKNPTVKRYLSGRFTGMLDNDLYNWVHDNKNHALSRGLLNTTLIEQKYSNPKYQATAKERIEARTDVMVLFATWEKGEPASARDFKIYKEPNEFMLRYELIQYAQNDENKSNEVVYYLGQNLQIMTPQNIPKLLDWVFENLDHNFSKGILKQIDELISKVSGQEQSYNEIRNSKCALVPFLRGMYKQMAEMINLNQSKVEKLGVVG